MKNRNFYSQKDILRIYAECWNTLNSAKLKFFLSDHVEYNSQWVIQSIKGKDEFLNYFNEKLKTLRINLNNSQVNAQIKTVRNYLKYDEELCLEITQQKEGSIMQVYLIIEISNGKITQINMCDIPESCIAEL